MNYTHNTYVISGAKLEHGEIEGGTAAVIHPHILVMATHTELVLVDRVRMDAVQWDAGACQTLDQCHPALSREENR